MRNYKAQYHTVNESMNISQNISVLWSYKVPCNMWCVFEDDAMLRNIAELREMFRLVKEKSLSYHLKDFNSRFPVIVTIKDGYIRISSTENNYTSFCIDFSEKNILNIEENKQAFIMLSDYIHSQKFNSCTTYISTKKYSEYALRFHVSQVYYTDSNISCFCPCELKFDNGPVFNTSITFNIQPDGSIDAIIPEMKNIDSKKAKKELIEAFLDNLLIII